MVIIGVISFLRIQDDLSSHVDAGYTPIFDDNNEILEDLLDPSKNISLHHGPDPTPYFTLFAYLNLIDNILKSLQMRFLPTAEKITATPSINLLW